MTTKQRSGNSLLQSSLILFRLFFLRVSQSSDLRSDDPHPVLMDELDGILSRLAVLPECHQRIFILRTRPGPQSVGVTQTFT